MIEKENISYKDEHTVKRIHEHLRNESDLISEQDIENVKIDFDDQINPGSSHKGENLSEKEEDELNNNTNKGDGEGTNVETPWNILSK